MAVKQVSKEEVLKALETKGTKIVNFTATWCGPCKMMKPVFEEIGENIEVLKVDVDQHKEYSQEKNVQGIPTTFIVKDGTWSEPIVGFVPKEVLESKLN